MNFEDKKGQGATEYLLMLAAVLVVVASAVYYVTQVGNYPAVGVTATVEQPDNIWLSHATGSIPAGDWQVEIEPGSDVNTVNACATTFGSSGSFEDTSASTLEGTVVLDNDVKIAQVLTGGSSADVDVTLSHVGSGHTYIETTVTVEGK